MALSASKLQNLYFLNVWRGDVTGLYLGPQRRRILDYYKYYVSEKDLQRE